MRQVLIVTFILLSIQLLGQIEIINLERTDSSVNIFYVGVENLVRLKTEKNFSNYQITVTGAGSSLYKIEKDLYIIKVNRIDTCTLIVSKNNKPLLKRTYATGFIANPLATLNGIRDTTINKNKILLNPFLSVIIPDCFYRHGIGVTSFQAVFIDNNDSTITNSPNHAFSNEQIKLTKQLKRGNKIFFTEIRAVAANSRTQKLRPFWIKIE